MPKIWDSITKTIKSLGGAAVAPAGAVIDLALMPFDDKDDDFGSAVSKIASRGADMLDPIINPDTLSGGAVTNVLEGAAWALDNVVNEPISTAFTMASHADSTSGTAFFDKESWSRAYKLAQDQSAGESFAFMFHGGGAKGDPFQHEDPYGEFREEHPILAPTLAWTANIVGAWYLDPTVLAGKGVGILREARHHHRMTEAERGVLYSKVTEGSRAGRLRDNPQSRTDKWVDWVEGKNSLGRPLEAPEILHGTPELKRYATEPHVIAGLIADTNKITNPAARRDAKRRILAVAAGDFSQVSRLREEIGEAGAIADALTNMAKGGTIDLKLLAANPNLRTNPMFIAHLEGQLDNLNAGRQSIDKFMDGWNSRLDQILETNRTMSHLPGVHAAGRRAIKRQNETGALRAPANAHHKVDDWVAKWWENSQSASSLFQRGLHTVPIVAVKTAGLSASPYTKAPVAFADAMRQAHFTGIANLHDWGGATTQLDSMMRLSGVGPGERMKALSAAYLAKTEPEKMRAISQVEGLAMRSMAAEFSAKTGREIDRDYIETLMTRHADKRGATLGHLRGRAYAATEAPDALRAGSAQRVDDMALGQSTGFSAKPQGKWRVDQINDDGTPLSLPLLETQLANSVPLLDMGIARRLLERDNGHLSRLSRAWKEESLELGRLTGLKAKGATGLDQAIAAKAASLDWLVDAGQKSMRVWKFSVLFRLGYPMRVVMDDHWRIWTQMGALSFYGDNGKEFAANLRHNRVTRGQEGRAALHDLKVRRTEILDELEGDRMVAHADRQEDLRKAKAALGGQRSAVTKLRRQLEEAEQKVSLGLTPARLPADLRKKLAEAEAKVADREGSVTYFHEQLGDYGPDQLKRELGSIEDPIRGGKKGLMPEKHHVGSRDVALDKGVTIEGVYGGLHGNALRDIASSRGTFDVQLRGVEDRMYSAGTRGSHRTIQPDEAGHLDAWADVLNHQFRNSPVAMHFIKGGSVDEFVSWVRQPAQAALRQRLSHFAHDPEDWGGRVQAMVYDYLPNSEVVEAVVAGRVSARQLGKMFQDPSTRPAVHGRAAADNIGTSERQLGIAKAMNRVYKFLGEMPTDRLSRHPYFSSLYKQHAKAHYSSLKASYAETGQKFTQSDLDDITRTARKLALNDLKRTLFDLSAHSHAAHVMRFVSPFFAAHQESIARWWRIVGDDPSVVRRFTQAFDLPRYLGLVIDEDGNQVKPGDAISREHRLLLQLPEAFGGPSTDPNNPDAKWSKWSISENSFNLVLQGGLTNPGAGPLVTVPVEFLAKKYADETEIARVARVFNPFPPQSPMEAALPATFKRVFAYTYGKTGVDPSLGLGIGMREYNDAYAQHVQDLVTSFRLAEGREPNRQESRELMLRAGRESTTQMFHRFLWNSTSPAPASPRSKYAIVQHGWYRISEQARAEGKDFEWAYARFKEKWGDAYMPLVYSSANNPAKLDSTPGTVAALRRYRGVLDRIDPALSRLVVGAYADDLAESNTVMGEYSAESRAFLRSETMRPGSPDTYYSYDDPATAMQEQLARRGWQKYGELTGALTAQAEQMGLSSYRESDVLVALKSAGVAKLRSENFAFDQEYGSFDSTQYDRYLEDMRTIVKSPVLANDTERTDIQTLATYLRLRDMFVSILEQREAAGFGGADAQANAGIRAAFTQLVGRLVESNTYFETHIYNGAVEKDPLLLDAPVESLEI